MKILNTRILKKGVITLSFLCYLIPVGSYHIIMMKQLIFVMVMAFSTCSLAGFVSYFRKYLRKYIL